MKRPNNSLADLYRVFELQRTQAQRAQSKSFDRQNRRHIVRLATRGVTTGPDLISALPDLPPKLKDFGIFWLQFIDGTRTAETALLRMLHVDPESRLLCASALSNIGGIRSTREFIRIGKTQLASSSPDRKWLEAVVFGLKCVRKENLERDEVLLSIFDRTDLPGWLRGDAGGSLGGCSRLRDRRTNFFRRTWATAHAGLHDSDIEVQFWSMYVIMQLAMNWSNPKRSNAIFDSALPRLHEIAATDHRLAPGFWWPMSAEAEDAIDAIETGNGRDDDAATRWQGNKERGPMLRDP